MKLDPISHISLHAAVCRKIAKRYGLDYVRFRSSVLDLALRDGHRIHVALRLRRNRARDLARYGCE